jgi:hypothetical protein
MSFLKKLFGSKEAEAPPPAPARRPPPPTRSDPAAPGPPGAPPVPSSSSGPPDVAAADTKQLTRYLGSNDRAVREAAAARLSAQADRTAMRPLLNAYLNYGDPGVLEALAGYGALLGSAVLHEANDLGLMGARRARLMDVAGVSGDPETMRVARDNLGYPEADVAVRAAVALARLGDTQGIDQLSTHLQRPDPLFRLRALEGLAEIDQMPLAKRAIEDHLDRYLAESGAVPHAISISAPRLEDTAVPMLNYLANHVDLHPHTLTVVVGSESVRMAATRRDEILKALEGHRVYFATPQMPPEEQIDNLRQARDAAEAQPELKVVFFGKIPAPHDSPPLPHFLTRGTRPYTAKMILVDPHELNLAMDWYHYVVDNAEVPTDIEIILSVSRPGQSAIEEEEYLIYRLLPAERREDFVRAYLAHL